MMKRGKDDEKTMEPMFPRLHVNDTEKGGPRGPPRNKMALYEQFSSPSQRSISKGDDHQKSMMFSVLHLNRPTHPAEESYPGNSNYNSSSTQVEQKRKLDEDDFTVPNFVQSEIGQDQRKHSKGIDGEKLFSFSPTYSGSMKVSSDREPKRARSQLHNSMCENDVSNEHVRCVGNGLRSNPQKDSCPEDLGSPNSSTSDGVCNEDETCGSLNIGNGDRSDDASEISMVDSIPGLDICPDDVVGVIGQKHFWKARRAIVDQQRVFAVQVFELHRLIKVQRSFAGSPHLLVEEGAYLGKPSKGGSFAKKLPLELIIKPPPHTVKHKDDLNKPSDNMECSGATADGKSSFSSVQDDFYASNCKPQSTPFVSDAKTSPWGFHQPPGQQWLIPVMSPSEGLIYKPYNPGHGFMGPLCGGYCLPPGSNPMMGTFVNPAYGAPSSHHPYQGIGVPPYGMPFVNGASSNVVKPRATKERSDLEGISTANSPGAISNVVKPRATKERTELQGISTASSPGEGARGIMVGPTAGGRNALPLLPTSQAGHVPERDPQFYVTHKPATVIKVVPRNAVSATESVARIFQSIQEGRRQCDSD